MSFGQFSKRQTARILLTLSAFSFVSFQIATAEVNQSFPRYDLERVGEVPESLHVGDSVRVRVAEFKTRDPKIAIVLEGPEIDLSQERDPDQELVFAILTDPLKPLNEKGEPEFLISPLEDAEIALPPLRVFEVDLEGKKTQVAETNPMVLGKAQYTHTLEDLTQKLKPAPLYGVLELQWPRWVFGLLSFLGLALLSLIAYLGYRFWKKRQHSQIPFSLPTVVLPEDEQALKELGQIESAGYLSRRQFKAHYFGVSEALKKYLGSRYRFDAQERTSGEILDAMKSNPELSAQTVREVSELFETLDRVKFTDAIPEPGEGEQVLQNSRLLVKATRKVNVPFSSSVGAQKDSSKGTETSGGTA